MSRPPNSPRNPRADPRATHAQAIVAGRVNRFLCNTLITRYAVSEPPSPYSLRTFDQIPNPNVASWTALIAGQRDPSAALRHFAAMLRRATLPNNRTVASLLRFSTLRFGLCVHSLSLKLSLSSDPFAGSALVNLYAKSHSPYEARKVFDEIAHKDSVCFAAVIVGFAQNSRQVEAVRAFAEMLRFGIRSTATSVSGALRSVAELASSGQCEAIHCHSVLVGLDSDEFVGSALVNGYGKSGLVSEARQVFDENSTAMNDVGWNAMISGYAQLGNSDSAVNLFNLMENRGIVPDKYSFLAVMTSLCNSGSETETERWFDRMTRDYSLEPGIEHYTCLISSLCRAGRLIEAERIATKMPFEPDSAVWRAMLSACARLGDADMALTMANRLLEINPSDDSAYVIVANAFSGAGRFEEAAEARKAMRARRLRKEIGRSWVEVKGIIHEFFAGDRRHEISDEIYEKLDELIGEIEKLGYFPVWEEMMWRGIGEEKRRALRWHSEKLAVAFGALSVAPGKALRVVKNLRICGDCHLAIKLMSVVLERDILVRDVHRYHRFSNGECSCGGVW